MEAARAGAREGSDPFAAAIAAAEAQARATGEAARARARPRVEATRGRMAGARAPSTDVSRGREPEATSEQDVLQQPGGLPPTVVAGTPSDAVAPGMVVVDAVTVPGTPVP